MSSSVKLEFRRATDLTKGKLLTLKTSVITCTKINRVDQVISTQEEQSGLSVLQLNSYGHHPGDVTENPETTAQ